MNISPFYTAENLTADPESLRFTYDIEDHSRSKKQKKDENSFFRDQVKFCVKCPH